VYVDKRCNVDATVLSDGNKFFDCSNFLIVGSGINKLSPCPFCFNIVHTWIIAEVIFGKDSVWFSIAVEVVTEFDIDNVLG